MSTNEVYHVALTSDDLLNLRMACSEMSSQWSARAGTDDERKIYARIANQYNNLWTKFYDLTQPEKAKENV